MIKMSTKSFTRIIKEHYQRVAIYVREDIKADYCYPLSDNILKESVWYKLRADSKDRLLIVGIYKSPNSMIVIPSTMNY